jgi:hypothetical protein
MQNYNYFLVFGGIYKKFKKGKITYLFLPSLFIIGV